MRPDPDPHQPSAGGALRSDGQRLPAATAAVLNEERRLISNVAHQADAERRSLSFTLQMTVALIVFALTPLAPGAHHIFGALPWTLAMAFVTPGLLGVWLARRAYRREGPDSPAYRVWEGVETSCLYGTALAFIVPSGLTWSVLWMLCPFTAAFWAATKPFHRQLYASIILGAHAVAVLIFALRGSRLDAGVTIAVGALALVTYEALAVGGRRNLLLEAERNVMREHLGEALLDQERDRIAHALEASIGREIAALARELEGEDGATRSDSDEAMAELVNAALDDLDSVARPQHAGDEAPTLADMAERLDRKCRPLCVGVQFEPHTIGDPKATIAPPVAHAVLRIAQELVRNATTHAAARTIRVELTIDAAALVLCVQDDGVGLSREAFARASGGVRNARRWVEELGGTLSLDAAEGPARSSLTAAIPHPLAA